MKLLSVVNKVKRGMLARMEETKQDLIAQAINEGTLGDPDYSDGVAPLDSMIKSMGGDPAKTNPSKADIAASKKVSDSAKVK